MLELPTKRHVGLCIQRVDRSSPEWKVVREARRRAIHNGISFCRYIAVGLLSDTVGYVEVKYSENRPVLNTDSLHTRRQQQTKKLF